jgi:hypothetical protein
MKRHAARRTLAVGLLALLAASCGGGGLNVSKLAGYSAKNVKPPPPVDTKRSGLPGLVLATNSPSLQKLAGAPKGEGAVILFVEPGGPSDGLGVGRGDLITKIAGESVKNHSRALALLHDAPGKSIQVVVKHRTGEGRTVTIKPRVPLVTSLRQYLRPLIAASPDDPILHFVRAQTPGPLRLRLADVEAALKKHKDFVEALTLGATLVWDLRPKEESKARRFVTEALDGWKKALKVDPENTTALTTQSTILSQLGRGKQALEDAKKAVDIDKSQPRAYYAVALAQSVLKHPELGAGPARASIELDPFNIQHWRLLATVFDALDRKDDCRRTAAAFTPFLEARSFNPAAASLRAICR